MWRLGIARTAVAVAVLGISFLITMTQGCNTTQSPNQQVTDTQITTQVKTKLAQNVGASSIANIDVNTTNGVVTLAGQVQNETVKHNSEQVANSIPGVVRVNDELQVAAPPAGG